MSLENAILRRTKMGQSFCSYTFRKVPINKGFTLINMSRTGKNSIKKKTKTSSIVTTDTNIHSTQNLKETKEMKSTNNTEMKPNAKFASEISLRQNKEDDQLGQELNQMGNKPNRMEQYLSELCELKEENKFKFNKFVHIPKNLQRFFDQTSNKKNSFLRQSNHSRYKKNVNNFFTQNITKKSFDSKKCQYLFQDFSLQENSSQSPFVKLKIVGLQSKLYIQCPIGKKLFSEIPIKNYCNVLNNYSTTLQSNIFYICLSKQAINPSTTLPYTQCFFWFSRPFKHSERPGALKYIIKFLSKCLIAISMQECSPKIWIVDFNGKISYINREQVYRLIDEYSNDMKLSSFEENGSKQIFLSSQITGNACLNMFLSTISKGTFVSRGNISVGTPNSKHDQEF